MNKRAFRSLLLVGGTASVLAVALLAGRPAPAEGAPWALAASDLAERSGTKCVANWNPSFVLPGDLDAQVAAKRGAGWLQEGRLFAGGLEAFVAEVDGISFGGRVDDGVYVNGMLNGELVTMQVTTAGATAEALVVRGVTRPIPCES